MKRLSTLIALMLVITIGGVYATWTYAGADAAGSHQHMSINLETATTTAAEGVISTVANTMNVLIDDTDKDYDAELVITGKMGFVFKPNAGASDDVVANGIPMQWQLEQTNPGVQYNGENIFTITQASPTTFTLTEITKITTDNVGTLCSGTDLTDYVGGFYVEVTAENVASVLSVSLELPTYADYTAFKNEINASAGKLGITISKATTPASA